MLRFATAGGGACLKVSPSDDVSTRGFLSASYTAMPFMCSRCAKIGHDTLHGLVGSPVIFFEKRFNRFLELSASNSARRDKSVRRFFSLNSYLIRGKQQRHQCNTDDQWQNEFQSRPQSLASSQVSTSCVFCEACAGSFAVPENCSENANHPTGR